MDNERISKAKPDALSLSRTKIMMYEAAIGQ
jgi:hypothetical protein